jgi:hypothetical protein
MSNSENDLNMVTVTNDGKGIGKIYHVSTPSSYPTYKTFTTKQPIGNTYIDGRLFDPQPDMTPVEASWISVLMAHASISNGWIDYDYDSFIHDHKLNRHFRKE